MTPITLAGAGGRYDSPENGSDRTPALRRMGDIMTISARITSLTACVFVAGALVWVYFGICLAYAIDCY